MDTMDYGACADCVGFARQHLRRDDYISNIDKNELQAHLDAIDGREKAEMDQLFDNHCNPRKMQGQPDKPIAAGLLLISEQTFIAKIRSTNLIPKHLLDRVLQLEETDGFQGLLSMIGGELIQKYPKAPLWVTPELDRVRSARTPDLVRDLGLPGCLDQNCVELELTDLEDVYYPTTLDPGSSHIKYWRPGGYTKPLNGGGPGYNERLAKGVTFSKIRSIKNRLVGD